MRKNYPNPKTQTLKRNFQIFYDKIFLSQNSTFSKDSSLRKDSIDNARDCDYVRKKDKHERKQEDWR
jgi:hypothetical protein